MENVQTKAGEFNAYSNDVISSASGKKRVTFNTASTRDYITNEAYKTLRTNLLFCGSEIKSIVITSCKDNEGKSTVSSELAKSLAETGKKTLFIDADMRKSTILKKSQNSEQIKGLSEVLSKLATVKEVVYSTQYENFDVIFSGHFPPNPVELIGNGEFEAILKEFKEEYDYIIVDSPPLGLVIDAAVIASFCDGAIMVLANRQITGREALEVKAQLEKSGCRILGTVINETDRKHSEYIKRYGKYGKYGKYSY